MRRVSESLHAQMIALDVKVFNATPSAERMHYALQIVANTFGIAALSLTVGALTGKFTETFAVLIAFARIRLLSGGYHLRSGAACIFVSSAVVAMIPHFNVSNTANYVMTAVAFVAMAIWAPANYDNYARLSKRYYPLLKAISCAVVALNFVIVSDILAITYIIQAATLPFKNKGEVPLNENEKV